MYTTVFIIKVLTWNSVHFFFTTSNFSLLIISLFRPRTPPPPPPIPLRPIPPPLKKNLHRSTFKPRQSYDSNQQVLVILTEQYLLRYEQCDKNSTRDFKRIHGWVPKYDGEYRFMSIGERYRSLEQTDNTTHFYLPDLT